MAETIKYMGETSLSAYDEKIKALIATKAASSHTHTIANITNLQTTLDGKAASSHSHAWSTITSKPSYYDAKAIKSITRSGTTFTYTCMDGTTGTFTQQDNNTTYTLGSFGITATATELNYCDGVTSNIQTQLNGKAASGHSHANLTFTIDNGASSTWSYNGSSAQSVTVCAPGHTHAWSAITGKPSTFAPSSHEHNYLTALLNPITSTSNDTPPNWAGQNCKVAWYTKAGQLVDQPSTYGFLLNMANGSDAHQLFAVQSGGDIYHRGGNGNGWSGTWRTILDSSNYTSYCAKASHSHAYVSNTDGTVSAGLNIGSSGGYIYTDSSNPGNIFFRYTATSGGSYQYTNLNWIISAINGKAASSHTHSEFYKVAVAQNTTNTNYRIPFTTNTTSSFNGTLGTNSTLLFNPSTGNMLCTGSINCASLNININNTVGVSGSTRLYFGSNAIKPGVDNSWATGTSDYRWTNVYAVNGTIKTSDENEKDILDSGITPDYENWYLNLKPILYKWKQFDWEEREHDRIHCGLGAQTTLAVAKENNLDEMSIAAICRDDLEEALPDGRTERYGIRYEELVSMNIHMIQKLYKENQELKQRIEKLESVA